MQVSRQRDWPKLMIRLPSSLKSFIEAEASRNGSSQNSEIVRCIRERMDRITEPSATPALVATREVTP